MGRHRLAGTGYLALDQLAEDPEVARRLPPDLARRFHALPVAEDHGRITVAMADPDDPNARDAVVAVLGSAACVVRADPVVIDSHLARIWGEPVVRPLDLVACCFPGAISPDLWAYAGELGALLGARLDCATTQAQLDAALDASRAAQAGLLLFGDARQPSIRHFLTHTCAHGDDTPGLSALWLASRPRWPLRHILLVIAGTDAGAASLDWTLHVARPAASAVTVLTIVPPAPLMYGGRGRMEQGLPALLKSATPLGQQMRDTARRLVDARVEATLRLRAGPAEWQLCHEIAGGDYDLVVLPLAHTHGCARWLEGDLLGPLLDRIDRPLLITAASPSMQAAG